ncbi:MAG TPA: helicase-associated domain-containing protein [Anaerolineae bacterium]|nr:helicase-associated domain-containing protein [Anaerolineae bacterium]
MPVNPLNPMVVQSDHTVLLEVNNPQYAEARDALARFAELEKSPEHIHTYRLSPLSLWNAAASGLNAESIVESLTRYSKYDVPGNIQADVRDYVSRFGRLKLRAGDAGELLLTSDDPLLMLEVTRNRKVRQFIREEIDRRTVRVDPALRGHIKKALVDIGFPAEDLAGYVDGAALPLHLLALMRANEQPFALRHYQQDAVEIFHAQGTARGGSGVIVLPCGAGKTLVGMGVMEKLQTNTLILTTNTVAVRQWMNELHDKTSLNPAEIGEYTGDVKEIRPVTVTTYQILTYRERRKRGANGENGFDEFLGDGDDLSQPLTPGSFPHFGLFRERNWGLVIYDEVHLLPAPVFRMTAELQARRRLGLTATLVREDGKEDHVFALIGPKKYDVPWKDLERQGWIATAHCHEIRLDMAPGQRLSYAMAGAREQSVLAATDPAKLPVVEQLVAKHPDDQVLVIGTYLDQLEAAAALLDAPLLTGKTPTKERQKLYQQMRERTLRRLVVSKVANFAVDLPDVSVAIEISGTFGSRQEEAQRLGRVLRPKRDGRPAHFYAIVMRDTKDQDFGAKRQMFLTEQGYKYEILYRDDLPNYDPERDHAAW